MEQARGFAHFRQYPAWTCGPARIVGGEVILDESRAGQYYIHDAPPLMFELAALALDDGAGDHSSILAFVRRYGLLWHGREDLGSGECRESLESWLLEAYVMYRLISLCSILRDSRETGSIDSGRRMVASLPKHTRMLMLSQ